MTTIALINILSDMAKNHGKRIFTLSELSSLADESHAATAMTLLRAERKKIAFRIRNLWVNFLDPPSLEELALALHSPSYISFQSALYQKGILSQSPRGGLTIATVGRPETITTKLGVIRFTHLKRDLFFGYDQNRVALSEKAWLDFLYVSMRAGNATHTETFYPAGLNRKRLRVFAKHFPACVQRSVAL